MATELEVLELLLWLTREYYAQWDAKEPRMAGMLRPFAEASERESAPPVILSPPTGLLVVNPLLENVPGHTRLSVVLPTYNESKNIVELLRQLTRVPDIAIGTAYEIIAVDDDSPGRTWELALSLTPEYPRLRVIHRLRERGLPTAVIRGWQMARGKVLAVLDADLQHPRT